MDLGRYASQQGWDSNSALEGYGAVNKSGFRTGGSYSSRRNLDEGFPNDTVYQRGSLHSEILDRDYQTPPPTSGIWSQSRRDVEKEYGVLRESRRHERSYPDTIHERDNFQPGNMFHDNYSDAGGYNEVDNYETYRLDRSSKPTGRENDAYGNESYEYRRRSSRHIKERSHDENNEFSRYNCDFDYERSNRENGWRRHGSRDMERDKRSTSYERDPSPHRRWRPSRSRSRGCDERSRSRSPRGRDHDRNCREDSYDRSEKWIERDYEDRRHFESVGPSATVVVKGLSQKTTEDDLYKILADWGPLRHVRVIRERNSGISRGFAFIDFPSVETARNMMDAIGHDGLVFDGRKIFFEYSSKPTGAGAPGQEFFAKSSHFRGNMPSDWMCTICGCINFARRTSCFQCNEGRTDDAPTADAALGNLIAGRKGSDVGPTHVLVVRGLDENADEEILRYEFAKHAPIKDIRLVRDKFTHVSRGFAFVHFHSVDDAKRALEEINGTKLEKNGNVLRVAFAKSINASGNLGALQSSSLAAAAIEAATFAQQYDAVGWAPKEYNSDASGLDQTQEINQKTDSVPQSGFVWDEKSGYYYDAASGFYYDGNSGLYYDGNSGTWFSYDQQNQQYVPCTDPNDDKESRKSADNATKSTAEPSKTKTVISAPAATVLSKEKTSLPDAVQAAAAAALAAEKKTKEKTKEVKLSSKNSIVANKKRISNVLTQWKQRNQEGKTARVVLNENDSEDIVATGLSSKSRYNLDSSAVKEKTIDSPGFSSHVVSHGTTNRSQIQVASHDIVESQLAPKPIGSSGGSLMGVIRSSGRGVVKSDTNFSNAVSTSKTVTTISEATPASMPFRTDVSALGSYAPSPASAAGKRRFCENPLQPTSKEQPQSVYRDRAAERRGLYGSYSSSSTGDFSNTGTDCEFSYRKGSTSDIGAMPFPPGVGGGHVASDARSYEVMTVDRAIDENNVGNKMLRNMGWQEGSGLGKDGSGITEPVQAQGMEDRAGLGRHQRKVVDPDLEVQAGDSYRTLIQKKAIARFREMS